VIDRLINKNNIKVYYNIKRYKNDGNRSGDGEVIPAPKKGGAGKIYKV
jgi:hypothetical protein